jgi:prepilin-type N-terminal cleavage/methylation domain-containing protein
MPRARDDGFSLVEVIMAVFLLGTAAIGTLNTLVVAMRSSEAHRQHSAAQAWLQNASDAINAVPRMPCTYGEASMRSFYLGVARAVPAPNDWSSNQISIERAVEFWNGTDYGSICYEDIGLRLQKITLTVTSPDGEIIKQLEMVKGVDQDD